MDDKIAILYGLKKELEIVNNLLRGRYLQINDNNDNVIGAYYPTNKSTEYNVKLWHVLRESLVTYKTKLKKRRRELVRELYSDIEKNEVIDD